METLMTVELYRTLSEKQRRLYLGQMALLMGRGGIAHLRRFYGASRDTISKGIKEVQNGVRYDPREGERRSGGGRHSISEVYQRDVDQLVVDIAEGSSYGSPTDERTWTTMSCAKIAEILAEKHGINTTSQTVSNILRRNKLSRQQNQKMRQNGPQDPERDKQFRYIEEECELIKRKGGVILSADVKKKELIGNFKAKGSEWRRSKNPREVEMHDFPLAASEKLIPYGIYDIQNNEAYITLNTSHETAELIYQSIRTWWFEYGSRLYPCAKDLLYLTDAGGSDGYRSRVFKKYMHRLADETGLVIHVSHYPPGTSKWNKIEHRVFAPMSKSMQGKPLICVKYAMLLISNTTTNTGLAVHCRYDPSFYQTGQRLSTQEYSNIPILRKKTVPRLNYYFIPEVFRSVALKWIT